MSERVSERLQRNAARSSGLGFRVSRPLALGRGSAGGCGAEVRLAVATSSRSLNKIFSVKLRIPRTTIGFWGLREVYAVSGILWFSGCDKRALAQKCWHRGYSTGFDRVTRLLKRVPSVKVLQGLL